MRFNGIIPEEQGKMLQLLDHYIPIVNEGAARKMREMIHKATF